MPEESPVKPNNPTTDFTDWCSSCTNDEIDRICCNSLAYMELYPKEMNLLRDRGATMTFGDDGTDVALSYEEGTHLYWDGSVYKGKRIGPCNEKTPGGLCRLQEEGIEKPLGCRIFKAGGKDCVKARLRNNIITPSEILTIEEP